jgi:uncharacterized phage protein (TIGR01671 family)
MREIKFRGKRKDNGEWVYGNLAIDFDGNCIIFTGDIADYYAQTLYEVIPESVGQFTGLKDKDGRENYECDVVEWECEYDSGDNDQSVIYERKAVELVEGVYEPVFAFHIDDMPKVIGNTTDNPELLEAK